jgi:RNA polymerase sigma factor (TIGR02999 family)
MSTLPCGHASPAAAAPPVAAAPESPSPGEISLLLRDWNGGPAGGAAAADRLLHLVYPQLRGIAARQLGGGDASPTLAASDLAHEALLRLLGQRRARFRNRRQFFAVAARLVRRVLVDRARERAANKRFGGQTRVGLDAVASRAPQIHPDLLALDRALVELAAIAPQAVRVVELRYFAGLSIEQTASALGVGRSTVVRNWRWARAWLERRLRAA